MSTPKCFEYGQISPLFFLYSGDEFFHKNNESLDPLSLTFTLRRMECTGHGFRQTIAILINSIHIV